MRHGNKTPNLVHEANVAGLARKEEKRTKHAARPVAPDNVPTMDELAERLAALEGVAQMELFDAVSAGWTVVEYRELDAAFARRKQA